MATRPNLFAEGEFDDEDPPGYRGAEVLQDGSNVGRAAGGRELNVRVFVLPAGESLCPYHYEYVEEWLMLLEGELDLRTPAGEERLTTGAVACFPSGSDGAHKVTTPAGSERPARFVMFSDGREPAVAVYPDSDKIGVWVPGRADNMLVRRPTEDAGYYDGELGE
ncbi:MAG: cupin domain-containing protein [Solirubrobacteraceae bacterium]